MVAPLLSASRSLLDPAADAGGCEPVIIASEAADWLGVFSFSREGPPLGLESLEQHTIRLVERETLQQFRATQPGAAQALLAAPAADGRVVAGKQHRGHSFRASGFGPGVVRAVEQAILE